MAPARRTKTDVSACYYISYTRLGHYGRAERGAAPFRPSAHEFGIASDRVPCGGSALPAISVQVDIRQGFGVLRRVRGQRCSRLARFLRPGVSHTRVQES